MRAAMLVERRAQGQLEAPGRAELVHEHRHGGPVR